MNRKLIIITLLFGLTSTLFIWFSDVDYGQIITYEDGLFENLTAIFYLIAFVLSLLASIKNRRFKLAIIWVFLSFVFLGEETSWFQRIFNYSVPLVEDANVQNEFNIHNIEIFQGGGLSDGSFNWKALFKSQNLFRIGFFGYFLILPLLANIKFIGRILKKIGYIKPDLLFVITLLIVFITSLVLTVFSSEQKMQSSIAETREMLYAFFMMIYVISYIWNYRKQFKSLET